VFSKGPRCSRKTGHVKSARRHSSPTSTNAPGAGPASPKGLAEIEVGGAGARAAPNDDPGAGTRPRRKRASEARAPRRRDARCGGPALDLDLEEAAGPRPSVDRGRPSGVSNSTRRRGTRRGTRRGGAGASASASAGPSPVAAEEGVERGARPHLRLEERHGRPPSSRGRAVRLGASRREASTTRPVGLAQPPQRRGRARASARRWRGPASRRPPRFCENSPAPWLTEPSTPPLVGGPRGSSASWSEYARRSSSSQSGRYNAPP